MDGCSLFLVLLVILILFAWIAIAPVSALITLGVIASIVILASLMKKKEVAKKHPTVRSSITVSEIQQMAFRKRKSLIEQYYTFTDRELRVKKKFKSNMNPNGILQNIDDIRLYEFPSFVSSLLKSKKHEWVIFGFEKDKVVDLIWMNKGSDSWNASSYISNDQLLNVAKEGNYRSVLFFHNHPNANPNYYDCSSPSQADINIAQELEDVLTPNEINVLGFICERGYYYQYHCSTSESFVPYKELFEKQVDELFSKAEKYYQLGELESAVNIYSSVLEVRNSNKLEQKIKEIQNELIVVRKIKEHREKLWKISKQWRILIRFTKQEEFENIIKQFISHLENIEVGEKTKIAEYVKTILNSTEYQLLKAYIINRESESARKKILSNRYKALESIKKIMETEFPARYSV